MPRPRFSYSDAPAPALRPCDHPGCVGSGEFRAPRSRATLDDFYWFCLNHVREYNASWNYYAGMSSAEVEAHIRHDTVWQRPSWRLGDRHGPGYADRIRDPLGVFSGGAEGAGERRRPHGDHRRGDETRDPVRRALSAREQALAVFEIEPPFTLVSLKARYKVLVKLHHPDAHGGDKAAEEKLKIINQAYATLKASYFA